MPNYALNRTREKAPRQLASDMTTGKITLGTGGTTKVSLSFSGTIAPDGTIQGGKWSSSDGNTGTMTGTRAVIQ